MSFAAQSTSGVTPGTTAVARYFVASPAGWSPYGKKP